jgi:hypothetical protein
MSIQSWAVLDLETIAPPDAADWVEIPTPADAPENYKKPEAIAKWCEDTTAKRINKAAVDIDLASLLCVGVLTAGASVYAAWDESGDVSADREVGVIRRTLADIAVDRLVGFGIARFDLPLLLRRAQVLDMQELPRMETRYRETTLVWPALNQETRVIDLEDVLTWQGRIQQKSLAFYARRFGCPVEDDYDGSQIASLFAAREFAGITAHCRADLERTAWLAMRLGVLTAPALV